MHWQIVLLYLIDQGIEKAMLLYAKSTPAYFCFNYCTVHVWNIFCLRNRNKQVLHLYLDLYSLMLFNSFPSGLIYSFLSSLCSFLNTAVWTLEVNTNELYVNLYFGPPGEVPGSWCLFLDRISTLAKSEQTTLVE